MTVRSSLPSFVTNTRLGSASMAMATGPVPASMVVSTVWVAPLMTVTSLLPWSRDARARGA